jgi:hypothetical protein
MTAIDSNNVNTIWLVQLLMTDGRSETISGIGMVPIGQRYYKTLPSELKPVLLQP